jgi:hypothetical protein
MKLFKWLWRVFIFLCLCGLSAPLFKAAADTHSLSMRPGEILLLANAFESQSLEQLLPSAGVPDNTTIYAWDEVLRYYVSSVKFGQGGWHDNITLAPGQAFWLYLPPSGGPASPAIALTLSGVRQTPQHGTPVLSRPLAVLDDFVASPFLAHSRARLGAELQFPARDFDSVLRWDNRAGEWQSYIFIKALPGFGWMQNASF